MFRRADSTFLPATDIAANLPYGGGFCQPRYTDDRTTVGWCQTPFLPASRSLCDNVPNAPRTSSSYSSSYYAHAHPILRILVRWHADIAHDEDFSSSS
jgi:hypothetical protein